MNLAKLAAALGLASLFPGAARAEFPAEVRLEAGILRGTLSGGGAAWKGIRYAAPPVGPLRWRAPQPAPRWDGIRDADGYGNDCMQAPVDVDAAPLGAEPDEDCLYLNLWRPAAAGQGLPVLVWIHGGAFVNGGASPATYSGEALARQGIVFVGINYRLGRFGTFAHPALTAADEEDGLLGNYGLLDQIAALEWVRDNVAAFGGDPGNVTLMGESAGGASVHFLATSPLAQGLFHKAAILSGMNGGRPGTATQEEMEAIGTAFAARHGIEGSGPEALAALRALPAEEICGGLNWLTMGPEAGRTWAGPYVDGRIMADPGAAYAAGAFAHVPALIGATDDDLGGRTGYMVAGARQAARTYAAAGLPVWHYRFSYVPGSVEAPGAGHASDIPFFLATEDIRYGARTTAADRAAAAMISGALLRFVRRGDPNGPGLPHWPRYDPRTDIVMEFRRGGGALAGPDPWGAEIDAAPPPCCPDPVGRERRGARP
ncbi:carboxylesterase/lipase family protein [Mangrovicoccus sp. HB161399]|uniref:carboxylesterase/lipase family protein n=1 Tax=Mangrovicoccus sp. HB161399 TaxID=2720392 RepID=UPI001553CC68|nr:carboxylesterase family protein [Mangrovicoccus sp. HB161399]